MKALGIEEFDALSLPEISYLLYPVIPRQGLVLLYSARGVGKTHVALGIAYAVASGGRVLRWKADKPEKVLYLDGEMSAARMQERIRRLHLGRPRLPHRDSFRIATPDLQDDYRMPDLSTREGREAVDKVLEDASLVVVDNLSCLCRGGDENAAESWLPVQEWILGLRAGGRSVLLVHHAGKGGAQRGTSRREDVLDTVVALTKPEDYVPSQGARFRVDYEKHRSFYGDDAESFEASFRSTERGVTWEIADVTQKRKSREEKILDMLTRAMNG